MSTTPTSGPDGARAPDVSLRQLTPLLVWAVVFCDIGTSLYYVPGVLYRSVGEVAPFFVWIGLVGFVLLAFKYVEICWRTPDGGGVVSVATQAFTPTAGAIGGLLITIGYFVTSAISSVAGIHYLGSVVPYFEEHVVALAVAILLLLAIVNTIGIRESAMLSLVMASAAVLVDLFVVGLVVLEPVQMPVEVPEAPAPTTTVEPAPQSQSVPSAPPPSEDNPLQEIEDALPAI